MTFTQCLRECDLCGECECGPGKVGSDAGDDRGRDQEGPEGEGGALGREARAEAEDWVSNRLIKGAIAFE